MTCSAAFLVVSVNYFQQDNLGLFSDGDPYYPTTLFYFSQILHYSIIMFLIILCLQPLKRSLSNTYEAVPRARRSILRYSAFCGLCVCILSYFNIILSISFDDNLRSYINGIYQLGYALCFILAAIALIIPKRLLWLIIKPLEHHNEEKLWYLVSRLYQITPINSVHEKISGTPSVTYSVIEINDLMRVILTNLPHKVVSPQDTAHYIFQLLLNNVVFLQTGMYEPSQISINHRQYYLAVARHLKRLERAHHLTPTIVSD